MTYITIIALTNQAAIFLNDQAPPAKSFYDFTFSGSYPIGKTCVSHDGTIIPPGGKLLCVGDFGLSDGQVFVSDFFHSHSSIAISMDD